MGHGTVLVEEVILTSRNHSIQALEPSVHGVQMLNQSTNGFKANDISGYTDI
jgi:hypothetical protein